jgi:lmo2807 protein
MKNKRSHGMKKFLAVIAVVVGVFSLFVYMSTPSKQRMNEELKKPEVVEVIEEAIKKRDSKAFTEAGKIKTYNIDYDKTYYNPMGGIEVIIYVNGNQNLKLQYTVIKSNNKYEIGSGSGSEELAKLLKEE